MELDISVTATTARDFAKRRDLRPVRRSRCAVQDALVPVDSGAAEQSELMEQLLMIDALKRGSAKRITAIMLFYCVARQDKKHRGREPISVRLVADLLKTAGGPISVDLHTDQIQGFFDGPVDHMRPAAAHRLHCG